MSRPSWAKEISVHMPVRFVSASCLVASALLLIGCQREVSGGYISKFTDGLCWLQLVRTPDNRLTGQFETMILSLDGKIARKSASLVGAADGKNISMSASSLGFQTLTLSGTLDGNKMTLTSGQASPIVLTRSDLSEYQRELTALNAQEAFISGIDRVVSKMQQLESQADAKLTMFPGVEERYHWITTAIAPRPRNNSQLEDLDLAIKTANQTHTESQALQTSLPSIIQRVTAEATPLEQTCRGAAPDQRTAARNAACNRLFLADGGYRQKFEAMVRGLAHLEEIYQQERKTQEGLLRPTQP